MNQRKRCADEEVQNKKGERITVVNAMSRAQEKSACSGWSMEKEQRAGAEESNNYRSTLLKREDAKIDRARPRADPPKEPGTPEQRRTGTTPP